MDKRRDNAAPPRSSFVRMAVCRRAVLVALLAMFVGGSRVLFGLFVLAQIVMMGGLMMMVRGGVVVSGSLMVMLARRMLGHFGDFLPYDDRPHSAVAATRPCVKRSGL
jgi:hypothetical protein